MAGVYPEKIDDNRKVFDRKNLCLKLTQRSAGIYLLDTASNMAPSLQSLVNGLLLNMVLGVIKCLLGPIYYATLVFPLPTD